MESLVDWDYWLNHWPDHPIAVTRANAADGYPRPLTPLSQDLILTYEEAGVRKFYFEKLAVLTPADAPDPYMLAFYGLVYLNADQLAGLGEATPGSSRQAMYQQFFGLEADPDYRAPAADGQSPPVGSGHRPAGGAPHPAPGRRRPGRGRGAEAGYRRRPARRRPRGPARRRPCRLARPAQRPPGRRLGHAHDRGGPGQRILRGGPQDARRLGGGLHRRPLQPPPRRARRQRERRGRTGRPPPGRDCAGRGRNRRSRGTIPPATCAGSVPSPPRPSTI